MTFDTASHRYQPPRLGLALLYSLVAFLFVLFVLRFWYLQVLHGEEFSRRAAANRTRQEHIHARRGIIEDAKGRQLAENTPSYALTLIREDCPDIPATLAQISQWTDEPLVDIETRYRHNAAKIQGFKPQIVVKDISFEKVLEIEEQLYQWPGLAVEPRQRRNYPYGPLFAHILGYVADANEQELKADTDLDLGDIIGKQGLELVLEKRLRGSKGLNSSEVDVLGRPLTKRKKVEPVGGEDITLSLDIDLQAAASEALGDNAGAVVVMEPLSGKVRALVTHPSYDNNIFTSPLSREDWDKLVNDPRHPLQNRAIQSVYPPGSVWKLMMAGLFLEQGIDPKTTVRCAGRVTLGKHSFRCWKGGGHGMVDMMQSLIHSCDVYYYEMSQRVGIDAIERFAKACGFGRPSGIDLPHERGGLVPGREWKQRRFKEPWQRGETLNISIGQGYTLVTPLQMAVFLSALINDGNILKPSLEEREAQEIKGRLPIAEEGRNFILDGMRVTASSGTARVIRRPDAAMGGKTGTAQVVKIGAQRLKAHQMEYKYRDHAWLTAFGSKDDKTYVVVVMVEHGGGGSSTAGPIVAKVFDSLFGPVPGSPAAKALEKKLAEERAAQERAAEERARQEGADLPGHTPGQAPDTAPGAPGQSPAQPTAPAVSPQAPASRVTPATPELTAPAQTRPGLPGSQPKKERPKKRAADYVDPSTLLFF